MGTFKIKLSNDYISSKAGGVSYADTKLFLFDYLHGVSNSSFSQMKLETRQRLRESKQWCDDNHKSTEFMLEYMQDFANVDLDTVLKFLENECTC